MRGSERGRPDLRICERCPLGPQPTTPFCVRCEVDVACVEERKRLIVEHGPFVHRGVDYGPALEYWLLNKLLPLGDPVEDIRKS